ncbi:MAG: alpha/beta fold hydrolase [Trueperaceae bacterium]
MRRFLSFIGILALIALAFRMGVVYTLLPRSPVLLNQDAVVEGVDSSNVRVTLNDDARHYIEITPTNTEATTLFIFYPGGLVRPQSYQWLGVALAPLGIRTVIPVFTADLAVTAPNRAGELMAKFPSERVVLGGHSLGGAMVARYALKTANQVDALVLLAAFSAASDDLSELELPVLVLAAERDEVATLEEVKAGLARLPPNATFNIIEGVVHSFFGRYGPQRGDGLPTITREQAEKEIISSLEIFLGN